MNNPKIEVVPSTESGFVTLKVPLSTFTPLGASGLNLLVPPEVARLINPDFDRSLNQAKSIRLEDTLLASRTVTALKNPVGSTLFDLVKYVTSHAADPDCGMTSPIKLRNMGWPGVRDILSELCARDFITEADLRDRSGTRSAEVLTPEMIKMIADKRAKLKASAGSK